MWWKKISFLLEDNHSQVCHNSDIRWRNPIAPMINKTNIGLNRNRFQMTSSVSGEETFNHFFKFLVCSIPVAAKSLFTLSKSLLPLIYCFLNNFCVSSMLQYLIKFLLHSIWIRLLQFCITTQLLPSHSFSLHHITKYVSFKGWSSLWWFWCAYAFAKEI